MGSVYFAVTELISKTQCPLAQRPCGDKGRQMAHDGLVRPVGSLAAPGILGVGGGAGHEHSEADPNLNKALLLPPSNHLLNLQSPPPPPQFLTHTSENGIKKDCRHLGVARKNINIAQNSVCQTLRTDPTDSACSSSQTRGEAFTVLPALISNAEETGKNRKPSEVP
ncbi:hypothetical protein P4O66_001751 [Electrophorus voltai]|uniref:Uncharacterized protein n=1 Tax=Electrophorus voltai TaxID=2609070 RepID=A0AAD8Z5U2_9TELE|nr:hypothetical protein P4O66_001751 [Electrophorus voltai]